MNQRVKKADRGPLFSRLRKDSTGNTLAMVAIAMVPVTAMIGSGVDLSRGYLGRTKLQQACDAGILAGRRLVSNTDTSATSAVIAETRKYFAYNWPAGTLGGPSITVTPTLTANAQLQMSVATTIPTTVMRMFGQDTMELSASCTGRDDYTNLDVMLVLDTTRSMGCVPNSTSAGCTPEDSGSKLQGLRDGVLTLYDTLKPIETQFNTATTNKKRIRYGIVPYAMMVNVGHQLERSWLQDSSVYRISNSSTTTVTHNAAFWGNYNTTTKTWDKNGAGTAYLGTWDGCIEERSTVNTITSASGLSIPSGAKDLDLDLVPNSNATKWPPADDPVMLMNTTNPPYNYACPKEARRLAPFANRTELSNYLLASNGFVQGGATYHDIGLIWGGRFLSSTGLYSADNPTTYNTYPVTKHLIFMTDGDLSTNPLYYTAYGYEAKDLRVTTDGTDTTADANHNQRFKMICNKIKSQDTKIWVISFGTSSSMTQTLKDCSSGTGYWKRVTTNAELATLFKDIGENIGSLRLSQ